MLWSRGYGEIGMMLLNPSGAYKITPINTLLPIYTSRDATDVYNSAEVEFDSSFVTPMLSENAPISMSVSSLLRIR